MGKKKALFVNTQLLKGDIVNEGGTCVCVCVCKRERERERERKRERETMRMRQRSIQAQNMGCLGQGGWCSILWCK